MKSPDSSGSALSKRQLSDLLVRLRHIRTETKKIRQECLKAWRPHIQWNGFRESADNMGAYIGLRRHDLRDIQSQLAALGLSSLGRTEGHVLANLNAVIYTLEALTGKSVEPKKILAAAHMQGKFWEILDAVFAAQSAWAPHHRPQPELVWKYIGGVGLDMERLRRDVNSPVVDKIVQQDINDAVKLNLTATPENIVDGKPLQTWGWEQLKSLVESELSAAY